MNRRIRHIPIVGDDRTLGNHRLPLRRLFPKVTESENSYSSYGPVLAELKPALFQLDTMEIIPRTCKPSFGSPVTVT